MLCHSYLALCMLGPQRNFVPGLLMHGPAPADYSGESQSFLSLLYMYYTMHRCGEGLRQWYMSSEVQKFFKFHTSMEIFTDKAIYVPGCLRKVYSI